MFSIEFSERAKGMYEVALKALKIAAIQFNLTHDETLMASIRMTAISRNCEIMACQIVRALIRMNIVQSSCSLPSLKELSDMAETKQLAEALKGLRDNE